MTDQQKQRALRRLLQNFEKRVGARPVEFVHRVDDGDAPTALPGCRAEERYGTAHVIDGDLLAQHAFLVGRALEDKKIALPLGGDPARHRIVGVDRKRFGLLDHGCGWIGMREHEASHAVGQRRLANALGSDDEKRVRHAGAAR